MALTSLMGARGVALERRREPRRSSRKVRRRLHWPGSGDSPVLRAARAGQFASLFRARVHPRERQSHSAQFSGVFEFLIEASVTWWEGHVRSIDQTKIYPPAGLPEIDDEHELIGLEVKRLTEVISLDDLPRAVAIHAAVLERTATHFAHEERLMREIGYPALGRHKRAHDSFLARARLSARRSSRDARLSASFIRWASRVQEWFRSHVVREDFWLGQAVLAGS
jgi:hemerythrin